MPQTQCAHCGTNYRVAESQMRKSVRCKKCGKTFTVAPVEEADEVPVLEASPEPTLPEPARRRTPPVPPAPSRRRRDEEREERDDRGDRDDAPRPRRKRSREEDESTSEAPSNTKWILAGVGGLAVLGIIGVVAVIMVGRSNNPGQQTVNNRPGPNPVVPNPIVPNPNPGPNPILNPPPTETMTIPQAIEDMKGKDAYRAKKAMDFLSEVPLDPKFTKEIHEAGVGLLRDPARSTSVVAVLNHWANPDLLPQLAVLIEDHQFGAVSAVVRILGRMIDQDASVELLGKLSTTRTDSEEVILVLKRAGKRATPHLLAVLNTSKTRVRQEVEKALKEIGVEEKALRAQSVKDLTNPQDSFREQALKRLSTYKPDPNLEEEHATAARILIKKLDQTHDGKLVADAMKAGWVTKEQLPALLKILERGGFEGPRTVEILVKLNDPASYEPIAVFYAKNPQADKVVRPAFLAFGTPAEAAVMKLVGNPDAGVHRTALQILADIGTTKSLDALTKTMSVLQKLHPSSQIQLKVTIAKIRQREKK